MKLNQALIFVPDIPAAKRFYSEVLGFDVIAETENSLAFGGTGLKLAAFKCDRPAVLTEYAVETRSVLVFEVSNLDAELERLRNHKVRILHATPARTKRAATRRLSTLLEMFMKCSSPKAGSATVEMPRIALRPDPSVMSRPL